jgi:hypothetical protein
MAAGPGGLFGNDWAILAVLAAVLATALAIHGLFLFTLMRCLSRVHVRNRELSPPLVWIGIIPLVNHLWYFVMIPRVSGSLRNEWRYRGWPPPSDDFGHSLGMIYTVGTVVAACCNAGSRKAGAGLIVFVAYLVLFVIWIVYWVKIAGYSRRLGAGTPAGAEFANYDDEFRPRPMGSEHPRDDGERLEPDDDRQWPPPGKPEWPPRADDPDEDRPPRRNDR